MAQDKFFNKQGLSFFWKKIENEVRKYKESTEYYNVYLKTDGHLCIDGQEYSIISGAYSMAHNKDNKIAYIEFGVSSPKVGFFDLSSRQQISTTTISLPNSRFVLCLDNHFVALSSNVGSYCIFTEDLTTYSSGTFSVNGFFAVFETSDGRVFVTGQDKKLYEMVLTNGTPSLNLIVSLGSNTTAMAEYEGYLYVFPRLSTQSYKIRLSDNSCISFNLDLSTHNAVCAVVRRDSIILGTFNAVISFPWGFVNPIINSSVSVRKMAQRGYCHCVCDSGVFVFDDVEAQNYLYTGNFYDLIQIKKTKESGPTPAVDFDYLRENGGRMLGRENLAPFHNKLFIQSKLVTPKVLFTGDSTNFVGSSLTDNSKVEANSLYHMFSAKCKYDGIDVDLVRSGQSGQTSSYWMSNFLNNEINQSPDVFVIKWGINDHSSSISALEQNIRSAIARIRTALPKCVILLFSPNRIWNGPGNMQSSWTEAVSELYRKIARELHCVYFDLFHEFYDLTVDDTVGGWVDEWMDTFAYSGVTGNLHIHPKAVYNLWQAELIYSLLFPKLILQKIRGRKSITVKEGVTIHYVDGIAYLSLNIQESNLHGTDLGLSPKFAIGRGSYSIATDGSVTCINSTGTSIINDSVAIPVDDILV